MNEETRDFERRMLRHINCNAPIIEGHNLVSSRRVEGLIEMRGEAQAYRSVLCYAQNGLGNARKWVRAALHTAFLFQRRERVAYGIGVFSFGWEDGKLHHDGKMEFVDGRVTDFKVATQLLDLAGIEPGPAPAVIPRLFPVVSLYSTMQSANYEDLLLFFCRNDDIQIDARLHKAYSGRIVRRSVWLFLNEDPPTVYCGNFTPGFTQEEESRDGQPRSV